jgi:hypothetical protein
MEIKVLGPGCKNCVTLDRITKEVVSDLGWDVTIEKIEDYASIASYGVMSSGRVPTPSHLKEMLKNLS